MQALSLRSTHGWAITYVMPGIRRGARRHTLPDDCCAAIRDHRHRSGRHAGARVAAASRARAGHRALPGDLRDQPVCMSSGGPPIWPRSAMSSWHLVLLAPRGVPAWLNGPDMLTEGWRSCSASIGRPGCGTGRRHTAGCASGRGDQAVGLVGFCFGGAWPSMWRRSPTRRCWSANYGSACRAGSGAAGGRAPPCIIFGQADSYIDGDAVARIPRGGRRAGGRGFTYPGPTTPFDNADFVSYHPQASTIAWGMTAEVLAKHFARVRDSGPVAASDEVWAVVRFGSSRRRRPASRT